MQAYAAVNGTVEEQGAPQALQELQAAVQDVHAMPVVVGAFQEALAADPQARSCLLQLLARSLPLLPAAHTRAVHTLLAFLPPGSSPPALPTHRRTDRCRCSSPMLLCICRAPPATRAWEMRTTTAPLACTWAACLPAAA